MKITGKLIRRIYAIAGQLDIDNDMLHTYVFNRTGSEHISTLTMKEAHDVIDGLNVHQLEKEGGLSGKITYKQKRYIEDLVARFGWKDQPYRLKGFIKKYAKVEELSWLTTKQASNIIEGLKKVLEKESQKRSG